MVTAWVHRLHSSDTHTMRPIIRTLDRKIAPFLFVLLSVSAVTGLAYRIGKEWFGVDGQTGQTILELHTGEWISPAISPAYVLLTGGGLLFLLFFGLFMLRKADPKARRASLIELSARFCCCRWVHRPSPAFSTNLGRNGWGSPRKRATCSCQFTRHGWDSS
jgi:hypothetical protein